MDASLKTMRRIGLIGGTSWESTAIYYRLLNQSVRDRLGGLHSCPLVLSSVDFAPCEVLMRDGNWSGLGDLLADEARRLERAGVEALILCTNTMHKVADAIKTAVSLPFIDIRDVTGKAISARGCKRPLLLATRYTMEDGFFLSWLQDKFALLPMVPAEIDRTQVNAIIFDELCRGIVRPESKAVFLDVITRAAANGADSVIFGCTEIGMLIEPADAVLPVFDTTPLHVEAALNFSLLENIPV